MTRRRRLLGVAAAGLAGCITDPGRSCRGASWRLSLTPTASVDAPLSLDAESLSTAADAVVETAVEGEHLERCVVWNGDPGPSAGLREVGERLEVHLGIDLADRRDPVRTDAERGGEGYRLALRIEG